MFHWQQNLESLVTRSAIGWRRHTGEICCWVSVIFLFRVCQIIFARRTLPVGSELRLVVAQSRWPIVPTRVAWDTTPELLLILVHQAFR